MKKSDLTRFIEKYNLGGKIESVIWKLSNNALSTRFVSDSKNMLGELVMDKFDHANFEIGIYSTSHLKKLMGVLSDDIDMNLLSVGDKNVSIELSDAYVKSKYMLSDLSVIPNVPSMRHIPEFDLSLEIDSDFISTFIRGCAAIHEASVFAVKTENDAAKIIINYATVNTNTITFDAKSVKYNDIDTIIFDSEWLVEILKANRDCNSAVLDVSSEGLARIEFKATGYRSTYYLVSRTAN